MFWNERIGPLQVVSDCGFSSRLRHSRSKHDVDDGASLRPCYSFAIIAPAVHCCTLHATDAEAEWSEFAARQMLEEFDLSFCTVT